MLTSDILKFSLNGDLFNVGIEDCIADNIQLENATDTILIATDFEDVTYSLEREDIVVISEAYFVFTLEGKTTHHSLDSWFEYARKNKGQVLDNEFCLFLADLENGLIKDID